MAEPHPKFDRLEPEELEVRRLEVALQRFWDDFVRLPSKQKSPGRQYVTALLDEQPHWTTNDTDFEHAAAFTPNVFLAGLEEERVVEIPALFVVLAADADARPSTPSTSSAPAAAFDVVALGERARVRCDQLGLPAPHYELAAPDSLTLIWRIQPFHRPRKSDAGADQVLAWSNGKLWWRLAQAKLDLAFTELGSRPSKATRLLPLPHPSPRSSYLDNGAYLLDAGPDLPTLRVKDISQPLNHLDEQAWKRVRPHDPRAPKFLLGKTAWIGCERFLEAHEPKRAGERHAAALTQVCCYRWAGYDRAAILAELSAWADTNVDKTDFPKKRATSDELVDLVDWAIKKLVPGGPTEREAPIRGHYTRREAAIACVLSFLEQNAGAAGSGQEWIGTREDLAKAATLSAAVAGTAPVAVTVDSLKKLLPTLKSDHGVVAIVERSGETWTTRWRLTGAASPSPLPPPPAAPAAPAAPAPPPQAIDKPSPRDSLKPSPPQTGERAGQLRMSIGPLVLAPRLGGSSNSDLSVGFQKQEGGSGGRPLPPGEAPSAPPLRGVSDAGLRSGIGSGPPVFDLPVGGVSDAALGFGIGSAPPVFDLPVGGVSDAALGSGIGSGPPVFDRPVVRDHDLVGLSPLAVPLRRRSVSLAVAPELEARVRGLCRLGFSLTLLRPGSKEPIGERWAPAQHQRTTPQRLLLALGAQPDANLAIVCGEISSVVVVDLDSSDAVTWARENLPDSPIKTRTARGEHWFFRWPGPVKNQRRLRDVDADIKSDGGYVVAPGSRHPSGALYEALGAWTPEALAAVPMFERSWLEDVTEDELLGFEAIRAIKAALKNSAAATRAAVDNATKRRK